MGAPRRSEGVIGRLLVVAVAALASAATSAPAVRYPRNYPAWQVISGSPVAYGCAELEAWVAKSGKQGMGVTVSAATRDGRPCRVTVRSATFRVGALAVPAARLPEPVEAAAGTAPALLYLPFAFDNQTAWNRGDDTGVLELRLSVGDAPETAAVVELVHRRAGAHRRTPYHQPGDRL